MARTSIHRPAAQGDSRQQRREHLGKMIRDYRTDLGLSQAELGDLMAPFSLDGRSLPQTTISRWEAGSVELTLEQVYDLEEALSLRHGSLAASTGYVVKESAGSVSIAELLAVDPDINPTIRRDVIAMYKAFRKMSNELQVHQGVVTGRKIATGR